MNLATNETIEERINEYTDASLTWTDYFMETFLSFRLGSKPKKKKTCRYYVLSYYQERLSYARNAEKFNRFIRRFERPYYFQEEICPIRRTITIPISDLHYSELIPKSEIENSDGECLRIVIISDTHDRHKSLKRLPDCDILIHAGDILMTSRKLSPQYAYQKYQEFHEWFSMQPARHKIFIGGNHDRLLEQLSPQELKILFPNVTYLCNTFLTIEGLTIFGTPMSLGDSGNQAFQSTEFAQQTVEQLQHYQRQVTQQEVPAIDILITHGTCQNLRELVKPQMFHVSGHSHDFHGVYLFFTTTLFKLQ